MGLHVNYEKLTGAIDVYSEIATKNLELLVQYINDKNVEKAQVLILEMKTNEKALEKHAALFVPYFDVGRVRFMAVKYDMAITLLYSATRPIDKSVLVCKKSFEAKE